MLHCPFCAKLFSARGNLSIHLISHTKEKPYKCLLCSGSFGLLASLKKHNKVVHEGVKIRNKVQEKNWNCSMCSFKCINKHKLKAHLLKHSTELPFSCSVPGCGFRTKYDTSLPQHAHRMHREERPHECTLEGCNYKTNSTSNLYRHRKVHSKEKPFGCKLEGCNFSCNLKSSLKLHIYRVHSEEKPFKCSICDFRTKYKLRLRQHEDGHQNIKRFHCQAHKCGFATNSNHYLKHHFARKHTTKDLMCAEAGCNFRCATITVLKHHARKHVLPILRCPGDSCNFSTRMPQELRLHVSRQHKELKAITSLVPELSYLQKDEQTDALDAFMCPFKNCDYQTEFQHRYDRHVKTHDEEKRKHTCKFCSYRFPNRSGLQSHIQKHLGEKLYSCSFCQYTTLSSAALRVHAGKNHHIHVSPRARGNQYMRKWNCQTCSKYCASYNEFVLHSVTHLKAVVVLERLSFIFT